MTTYDEDSTDRLRALVEKAGHGRLTKEQIRWRIEILRDPDWCAFLELTEAEAKVSISAYRRQLLQAR